MREEVVCEHCGKRYYLNADYTPSYVTSEEKEWVV